MSATATKGQLSEESRIPPEEYAAFIRQIQLDQIWLQNAKVLNRYGPEMPEQNTISVSLSSIWEEIEKGFRASSTYKIRVTSNRKPVMDIEVTFGVQFLSEQPMTDDLFRIFEKNNLPVNTWPYAREYVANTMGRMNWLPFTLPAFKIRASGGGKLAAPAGRSGKRPAATSET